MQAASGGRCSSPDLPDYDSDDSDDVLTDGLVVPPSHLVYERAVWLEQKQAGQVVFTQNSKKLLSDMLDEVYTQLQPKRADWDARQTVIQFITKFVNHKIPGSSISAFGSFVMDLFTSSSDLDLSLNIADGRCDRSRNDKVHYLRKVAKALYGLQNGLRQSVQKIETVYRAAVPVVKFVEFKTGIECDISVENNDGVLKSRVLGMFSTMDSRFRQLCYLVKAWAKKHNVNSSKNGTLNSLSICLLVAFHLQVDFMRTENLEPRTWNISEPESAAKLYGLNVASQKETCTPPIFPPFSVFMEGLHLPAIGSCLQTVEGRVREYKNGGFGKDNIESVPELFGSFFLKVEDFADRTQNVARSVSRKEFELIYQVLQSTVSNLKVPVFDVLEAKDLKAYLFGSIKQRHKGLDHEVTASNAGNWQGGNGWSSSGDKRINPPASRGHELLADNHAYADGRWTQKVSTPIYVNRFQGGRGPGQRANAYQKVEQPSRIAAIDPRLDANGYGENRGLLHPSHPYRVQYPPLESRSNPVHDIKQVAVHRGPEYRKSAYRKEDFQTRSPALGPSYSGGEYIHRDADFPSIDAEHGIPYPDNVGMGYLAAEPSQVGQMTYATTGSRQRNHYSGPAPGIPPGAHHYQRTDRNRRPQKGRTPHPPGPDTHIQQYSGDGYPVHVGANVHWPAQASSNHQFLIR